MLGRYRANLFGIFAPATLQVALPAVYWRSTTTPQCSSILLLPIPSEETKWIHVVAKTLEALIETRTITASAIVSALEAWVEHGIAPSKLIATKYNNNDPTQGIQMQRPICPYPSEAIYKGSGNTNDASNFVCGNAALEDGEAN